MTYQRMTTYRVDYKKADERHARIGHVKAYTESEAKVKARKFVMLGGEILAVRTI